MAPPTRRSARGSQTTLESRDTPPQQDSVMIDGTDDSTMNVTASATGGRPSAAAHAAKELPVAEASSARNKRGAPDRDHRDGTSDASSRPSKSRKVRFSLPGPTDGEPIDVDQLEDEIATHKHQDISEDLDLVEEDDHPDIPLCGITVPLHGNGLLDKSKHSSQNPTVFRPASYKKVSRKLKEWFPDEVVANEEEGKAKKRKSPAATIVLEADLVHVTLDLNDPKEGETAQVPSRPTPAAPPRPRAGSDDDWNPPVETTSQKAAEATIRAIAILVHPPSKRAVDGAEQPTEVEPVKEDDLLLLGHIIPSSITASDHPLRYLDEYMIRHELIVLLVCQVSLQKPFFGHKKVNIPPGGRPRDGGYFYRPFTESSNKHRYLDAQLVMEVALPSRSLQYGRATGDDGFVAQKKAGSLKMRNFIASILQCNAPKEVFQSHIELDTEWPTTDFWQREGVNGDMFYLLPDRSPETLPAVLPQSLAAASEAKSTKDILQLQQRESTKNAGARGGRSSKKRPSTGSTSTSSDMQLVNSGEASTSTQHNDTNDQDPDDEKRHLPLATSISSLLRAARPQSTIAEAKLPEDTFKAPLYHFQTQAVQWMIEREKNVDVDIGAPMPQWLRIKSREVPSGGESEPSLPQKKAKTEQMTDEPIEVDSDSDSDDGEPEVFRFSLDVVSGTLSRKTFSLGGRRQPGGCLADAMGLGKTLEVLALIVCRPKPGPEEDWVDQSTSAEMIKKKPEQDRPFSTSATLVVAPSALIQQWVVETRRHLGSDIGILEYKSGWKGDEAPAVTMAEMQVRLENVAICFVSYETLVAEYSKSEKAYEFAKPDQEVAISPLLQVHWWRLVADEAQLFASKSTRTTAQTSINSLWRSSSWICSSSPLSSPRDLFSILTFLDFDIFADPTIFAGLVESAFQRGDAQDVRLLRSLIGKIMIRRERHDTEVAQELTLPSQTEQTLICKASGLEAAIWERESGKTKATIDRALGSGRKPPVEAVSTLRALLSHPSVASSLGYGNTDTFAGLLMRQATKLEREMYNRKLEIASLLLAMLTLTQALDKPNNRKLWKTGDPVFHLFELMELLEASQKECEDACKAKVSAEVDMAAIQGDIESTKDDRTYESVNGPSASVPSLGFEEALYWIKVSLGSTTATPPDRIDPERCLNLTFRRRIYKAEQVDTNDARYQPVVRDAGSTEDENWLDNLLGDKRNDPEAREVALRNYTTQGEGAVMVNRLRGQTQGSRAQAKVWAWFPRRKFSPLYTAYTTAQSKAEEAAKGLEWIKNRLKEVGISDATNAGDEEHENTSGECIICLDVPILAGVLPCYHSACLDCLEKIAGTGHSTLCPMCRRPFRRDQVSQVLPQQKTGGDGDASELGVKVNTIAKQVRQRLEKDPTTKVVVFALSRKMLQVVYKGLAYAGLDCAVFAGSVTAQQNALASFREKTPVLLCPMKQSEGAAGLTLTMANVAIIIEPVLDEALLAQACGRIHRIGQTRPTEILHLVAHNTIEAKIVELRQQRRDEARSGATVQEGETLNNSDLAFLFNIDVEDAAKRYNEERVRRQEQRAAEEQRVRDLQLQFEARQAARAAQMSSLPRTWHEGGGASSSMPSQAAAPAVAQTTVARPLAASSPQGLAPQLSTALPPLGPAPQAALATAPVTAEALAQQNNGVASSSSMWQRYETWRERVFSAMGGTSNSSNTGGGAGPSRGGGGGGQQQ